LFSNFRALKDRAFALLWSGQTISRLGDSVFQLSMSWWVLEKTGSPVAMGSILVATSVPMLIFLLIGGLTVDRVSRAHLMFYSDLARGIIVSVISVLAYTERLEVWHVLIMGIIFGFISAFFAPAYVALVPAITPRDDLPSANSLSALSAHFGSIAGPGVGALIVNAGGTPLAFGVNALSFFAGAAFLFPLLKDAKPPVRAETPHANPLHDLRDGLRTVMASPVLWVTILVASLGNMVLSGPRSVAMPFLVKDFLGGDAGTLALINSIFPVGFIAGNLWLGHKPRLHKRGISLFVWWGVASVVLIAFGFRLPLWALGMAAFAFGFGIEIVNLIWTNLMQELVPPGQMGRVSSIDMLGSFVFMPLGFALAGWATELIGPPMVFIVFSGLSALFAVVGLVFPSIRNTD
jgi:MFS family permease